MSIFIKDMDTPKSCYYCACIKDGQSGYECGVTGCSIVSNIRPSWCPLVEVIRCRDCEHYFYDPVNNGWNSCEIDALIRYENFFCASGERRTEE